VVSGIERTARRGMIAIRPADLYFRYMSFRVHTPSGNDDYSDADRYEYLHPGWGLLVVTRGDETKVVYGPAGWSRMEDFSAPVADGGRRVRRLR
jgi:hypothetical protein